MTVLDVLLVIIWLGAVLFGIGSGVVRQIFVAIAVYGGLIIAYFSYEPAAQALMATGVPGPERFLQAISYLAVFILVIVVVVVVSYLIYPTTALRGKRTLDRVLGALLALLWGIILVAGLLVSLAFLSLPGWPGDPDVQQSLAAQVRDSRLHPLLLEQTPGLPEIIAPWTPER